MNAATTFVEYLSDSEHRGTDPVRPINVAAVLAGGIEHPYPKILTRRDGAGLLYPAAVHSLVGPAESGKSWLALVAAAEQLDQRRTVVLIDYETSMTVVADRLTALGATTEALSERLVYFAPDRGYTDPEWRSLHAATAATGVAIVIVDGVSEAFAIHGLEVNSTTDAAGFSRKLRPFAAAGAAVIQIDHVSKGGGGRTAIGAQHKRAGVDVELWTEAVDTPHPRHPWRIRIGLSKDRHGGLYEYASGPDRVVAEATVLSDETGTAITLAPPGPGAVVGTSGGGFRPTEIMDRISSIVESAGGDAVPMQYALDAVGCKASTFENAISALARDGTIRHDDDGLTWPTTEPESEELPLPY